MPSATDRIEELREQADEGEIPYFSKSRVKKYKTCPRQFYHVYIEGRRAEETDAMRQGTRVHEVFEDYYADVVDFYETAVKNAEERGRTGMLTFPPEPRELVQFLPDEVLRWADWMEFMANFLAWECERAEQAMSVSDGKAEAIKKWLPVGIEAEAWKDDEDPPWMGFADVIVNASTVEDVDTDSGVVIVDFKTGKTPKPQYRDEGIFLEGEYYGMIFKKDFDVSGVAGFYPKGGDFLVSDLSKERRETVNEVVNKVNEATKGEVKKEDFPIEEQPLCKWGEGEDEQCDFYDECPSNWGVPAEKRELFEQMVQNGNSSYQIADYMDCEVGHVYYWAKKFNLDL